MFDTHFEQRRALECEVDSTRRRVLRPGSAGASFVRCTRVSLNVLQRACRPAHTMSWNAPPHRQGRCTPGQVKRQT